jgi:DNA polymerase III subunit epsilon
MELLSRAIEFLHAHGSASSAELAGHVFGGEAFGSLLDSLRDERLVFDGAVWRLRAPSDELAILEVLATGPNPRRHRIVEVAARRGSARFETLIASPKPVPRLLRNLGVPELSPDCPSLRQAGADLQAFLGGATIAGFGFVPEFLEQLLGARWPAIDLSRLLSLHGFHGRPDPATVAKHFGLTPPLSHRPASMVSFSAGLLERLRTSHSMAELRVLGEPRSVSAPACQAFAEAPGVYIMASAAGTPLYVGKSVNLKRRVGSYLHSPIGISRNLEGLMESTSHIDVVPVDTDLEAVLLEKQLIDDWLPPFNVQRHWGERGRYLRLSTHEPFPRLTQAAEPKADGATYFGPFRHATAAARLRTLLTSVLRLRTCTRKLPAAHKPRPPCAKAATTACLAPCIVGPPAEPYATEVRRARELLTTSPDQFRTQLRTLLRQRPPQTPRALQLKRQLQALAPIDKPVPDLSLWG